MFCTTCAQPNPSGAAVCQRCGAPLPAAGAQRSSRVISQRRGLVLALPAIAVAASLIIASGAREFRELAIGQQIASAVRAGDPAAIPAGATDLPAAAALREAADENRNLRQRAIVLLGAGDPAAAAELLRTAVMKLPSDSDARDLLAAAEAAGLAAQRGELDRASATGDLLSIERIARGLASRLDSTAEAAAMRDLADRSAPIALARDADLWLVAPDGGNGMLVTDNVPVARPVWSPDRTRLAFVSSDFLSGDLPALLFVIDATGENLHPVYYAAHPNAIPSWSPDGRSIALTSVEDWSLTAETGRLTIAAVALDGGDPIDIGENLGAHATTPAWSPDRHAIAFISRPFQTDPTLSALSGPATVMLWSDDGVLRNLSGNALPGANRLLWNRDGHSLIVLSRDLAGADAGSGTLGSVSEIDLSTGGITTIADAIPTSSSGWGPASSPEGGRIAWVEGARSVIVRNENGERQEIDAGRILSGAVTWSPGGSELLAVAAEPGRPSARITFGAAGTEIVDAPLRYDLEWPTGTPQWSAALNPSAGTDTERPQPGAGLDR